MKQTWRRFSVRILCVVFALLTLPVPHALCAENPEKPVANEISGVSLVECSSGIPDVGMLFNHITADVPGFQEQATLTLRHDQGIGSVYLLFSMEYGSYRVINEDNGQEYIGGQNRFLHDFLDLEEIFGEAPARVTLCFENGPAMLNEIHAFSPGTVPDHIQKWEPPKEGETDLVLFSTHGDDEQLFFAGLLPYYGAELGYQVQVVYFTDHRNLTRQRTTEMLNGLWAVGIRTYPVFGPFPDLEFSKDQDPYLVYGKYGYTEADMTGFVVEQLRRFKPKVVAGHDINGEYGHSMHILYTRLLRKALEISNDPNQYPELASQYGVWDVPKTYIHLYPENRVYMNWDVPLERFGGMTAFEVTKNLGFACHKSQRQYFDWYFSGITRADRIPWYSPCEYGLYRSTVGEDIQKNDFFENVTTYAQDAETERLRQEEEERLAVEAATTVPTETEVPETTSVPAETKPAQTEPRPEPVKEQGETMPVIVLLGFAGLVFGIGFGIAFRRSMKNKKI